MSSSEQTFDRYQLHEEIGRGGFATVYKAFDPRFQREVALKVLPHHFLHDPQFRTRFEQEARIIASLEHQAIVPVYDFGEHEGQPFLVMRYMTGGSLRSRMRRQPLTVAETVRIVSEIAPALDKAHQRGIIHRDIKPDNVLFDEDGHAYLADFGIARLAEATRTMTIVGTPAYMSPEQVEGKQTLDGRSDIYALGVMLFELLTGKQPYEAATPAAQMVQHILEPVPNILTLNPGLPPASQPIIERVMAKDRADRYGTAEALAQAVNQLLQSETPPALTANKPAPKATTIPKTVIEREVENPRQPTGTRLVRPLMIPGGVVLLALLLWGSWAFFGSGGSGTAIPTRTVTTTSEAGSVAVVATALPTPTSTPLPAAGTERMREKDDAPMVYVPAGTFRMGSRDGASNETPIHVVTFGSFWLDQFEVTNERYGRCVNEGVCDISAYDDDDGVNGVYFPVVGVSWQDAVTYCEWVGSRLPTEAEWEYAARGTESSRFPWGNDEPDCTLANYAGCVKSVAPVGSYPDGRSWVNAYDMAGNVWEWVQDWYAADYYANTSRSNPTGPTDGIWKVLRGGSWINSVQFIRAANRHDSRPTISSNIVGFRCVQE